MKNRTNKPANTFLDERKAELFDLLHELGKLRNFMESKEFSDLPSERRKLINSQYNAIKDYCSCLQTYIELEEGE